MKILLPVSILILTILLSCSTADMKNDEPIIGVWVTNIDSDILFSDASIAEGMKVLAESGFNTVYPVVWNDGYTLHPSDVMSRTFGEEFRQDTLFSEQNRDPVEIIVREARKNNLRVIPWFEFGFSSSYNQQGGHILNAKPEWAGRHSDGSMLTKNGFEWMNAIHPDVQDFLISMILEVIVTYDIDGIQGDDRLPAMPSEGGYSEYTRQLYLEETGREVPDDPKEEDFLNWKADKLSSFAEDLYTTVKQVNPELTVSFSPSIYPWSKEEYLQDWPAWIERGAVDELIPQAYRWEIGSYKNTIDEMVDHFENSTGHREVSLVPGIIIKSGDRYNGFSYVKEAVEHNRASGLNGEVYFFYEGLFENNDNLIDSLRIHFYNQHIR